ncbi:recombinase family protein [Nocardia amamiensis]|uniref:recombinase family protein n=1 Tax=Nocardia amamiensis TaxID=404578 RepID=UPI000AB33A7C|nr:recombinase family protein [Nocardia amamiensis]
MGEPFRVGYCRCSTDEQDVEIQIEQLLTLAVPRERIFVDKGFSGTTSKNRTGLDNALTAVTSAAAAVTGRQAVLTATKFDRFARDMAEASQILTSLRERGVLFWLGSAVYDWDDPFGRLFLQTLAMVAEFEANLGHLRTREGMAKARARQAAETSSCSAQYDPPPLPRPRRRCEPGRPRRGVQRRPLHHPPHHQRGHTTCLIKIAATSRRHTTAYRYFTSNPPVREATLRLGPASGFRGRHTRESATPSGCGVRSPARGQPGQQRRWRVRTRQ